MLAHAPSSLEGVTTSMGRTMDSLVRIDDTNAQVHSDKIERKVVTSEVKKKRKSGVPTGNAGEYLVMGELLRDVVLTLSWPTATRRLTTS
jgi:hypothetical protein